MTALTQNRLKILLLILFITTVAFGCGDDDDDDDSGSGTEDDDDVSDDDSADDDSSDDDDNDDDSTATQFRIAVIADPAVLAEDVLGWNGNLDKVITAINGETDIDFVVILGDMAALLEDPWADPPSESAEWADGWAAAMASLSNLTVPFYFVPGDKDYSDFLRLREFAIEWADWADRDALLKTDLGDAYPGADPWYIFDHKGATFFAANTMAGDRRQDGNGLTGSMGADQLDALETAINDGDPMVFLGHHSAELIVETDGEDTLTDLLSAKADNIFALFSGSQKSYNEYEIAGINAYAFNSVSKNGSYYALVDIDPAAKTVTIVNKDELPYPETWEDFSCTPGTGTVGSIAGLTDTYHAIFLDEIETDNELINQLFADFSTPFPIWIMEETSADVWDFMLTQAIALHGDDFGENAMTAEWPVPFCQALQWQFDDPCIGTGETTLTYDVLKIIDGYGDHGICGVRMDFEAGIRIQSQIGDDGDGNTSFTSAQVTTSFARDDAVDALKNYIVDSYCAYECFSDLMTPVTGCDAEINGDDGACDAGTLAFEDVPDTCDSLIGSKFKLPARLVLSIFETLPTGFEVNIKFKGWGHQYDLVPDFNYLDQDWAMEWAVFGDECPESPPIPSK